MDKHINNNYDDIEKITINVIKILLEGNVPMDDIVHISGKSIEEINRIKEGMKEFYGQLLWWQIL